MAYHFNIAQLHTPQQLQVVLQSKVYCQQMRKSNRHVKSAGMDGHTRQGQKKESSFSQKRSQKWGFLMPTDHKDLATLTHGHKQGADIETHVQVHEHAG